MTEFSIFASSMKLWHTSMLRSAACPSQGCLTLSAYRRAKDLLFIGVL